MKSHIRILSFVLVVVLSPSFLTANVLAEEKVENELLKKGIYLFRQENYDEALDVFNEVNDSSSKSSLSEYYLGLTYKRLEDYVAAKGHFEASLSMTPKIKGALMELVDLLYRIGEFEQAKKWIKVAEDEGIRPAQAKFLKGLTLQKSAEYEDAVKAFEDAKDLDERLAQSANYQIGICYMKMKKFTDARDVFKDVFAVDPYSDLGEYASRYMDALDRKLEKQKPFHLTARTAFEYDSNVTLKPTSASLAADITDQDDTRQVYDVKADYTFRTEDNLLSLKTGYGFKVSKQNDLGKYDVIGNEVSAQGNISFEKVLATFPLSYSHTIVNDKNYLSSISTGNINNFMLGSSQMIQAGALYTYDDYLRPVTIAAEDRTGNELTAIAGWFRFFSGGKGFVNLRYSFIKDWTEGDNWDYNGNKISAGLLFPFWDKFKLSLNGEVFFQEFENTNTIFNKKRKDQVYAGASMFSYEMLKNIELQVRYTYINDQSNIDIYKYDRHIVSTGVQYKF